mgnify:CR=1 FL=1
MSTKASSVASSMSFLPQPALSRLVEYKMHEKAFGLTVEDYEKYLNEHLGKFTVCHLSVLFVLHAEVTEMQINHYKSSVDSEGLPIQATPARLPRGFLAALSKSVRKTGGLARSRRSN